MIPADVSFLALVDKMTFGRKGNSRYGFHVDEVDGLSVGEVQEVGVAQYNGTGQHDLDNVIRDPRIITISGSAVAPSMEELGKFEDLARGCLIDPESTGLFKWTEYGRTRWCRVRRYRGWRFRRIGSTGVAEFTARFRAPSQLVYGEERKAGPGTSLQLLNRGQFAAYPSFRITGTMPNGYRITSGGRAYVVTQALGAGQTHIVDMRDKILHRNGTPQVGAVSAPRLLLARPGATQFALEPVSGSGSMRIEAADTYL